jgi:hypothetical protein
MALPPATQELSRDGRFRYLGGRLPLPAPLANRAIALAERAVRTVPGLLGYVGVDLVLVEKPEGDRVIEINPRLTTSYLGLRRLVRGNLASALWRIARGEIIAPLQWYQQQVRFNLG